MRAILANAVGTLRSPSPPGGCPDCPGHLSDEASLEWERVAGTLHAMGVLSVIDRAALAAYCQAYGRWVEAEEKLRQTLSLFKTPSGYIQQSPWMSIANKQMELMGRYTTELGMTPAARSRVEASVPAAPQTGISRITRIIIEPAKALASIADETEDRVSQAGSSETKE